MIIKNHKNKKHAEAIIQYCKDNGMQPESTAGLWNHLVKLFKKMEKYEERAKAQHLTKRYVK